MDKILSTNALSVGYDKKIIVEDVEISIAAGCITTLIGPNGSGKTTILKTILRQLAPIEGCVFLSGKSLAEIKGNDLARQMAMVTTQRPRTDTQTCRDVVSMGRYPYTGYLGILTDEDRSKVDSAMDFMQVSSIADRDFQAISDGQRQRVMIARAICQEPQILVLDEPTSFLDIKFKLDILKSIYTLAKRDNMAVIMSLHELDLAKRISDEIVCVEHDHIGKVGKPEDIFTGGYIQQLYGIDKEYFDETNGMLVVPDWNV